MNLRICVLSILIVCLFAGGGFFGSINGKADYNLNNNTVVPEGGNESIMPQNEFPPQIDNTAIEYWGVNDTFETALAHPANNGTFNGMKYPILLGESDSKPDNYTLIAVYFDALSEKQNMDLLINNGVKKMWIYPKVILAYVFNELILKLRQTNGVSYLSIMDEVKSIDSEKNILTNLEPSEPSPEIINPEIIQFCQEKELNESMKKIVVIFNENLNLDERVSLVQKFQGKNLVMYKGHSLYSSASFYLPENELENLQTCPGIIAADLDCYGEFCVQQIPWQDNSVRATNSWPQNRGDFSYNTAPPNTDNEGRRTERVTVAIIDSGTDYTHPDFSYAADAPNGFPGKYAGIPKPPNAGQGLTNIFANLDSSNVGYTLRGWDPLGGDNDPMPAGGSTHGTCTAGLVGMANNGVGYIGIAPMSRIFALRVGNDATGPNLAATVSSVGWCRDNKINIVSMSFGWTTPQGTLETICNDAYVNAGCLLFAAAGNNGNNGLDYPARYSSSVISVGATDGSDNRCGWSNYGPTLELMAPGLNTPTTTTPGGGYDMTFTGTSASTPIAAGVAALLKSQNAKWTNGVLRTQLKQNAKDIGDEGRDNYCGYGLVQTNLNQQIEAEQFSAQSGVDEIHWRIGGDPWETIIMYHSDDWAEYAFSYKPSPVSGYSNYARLVLRASAGGTAGDNGYFTVKIDGTYKGVINLPNYGSYQDKYYLTIDFTGLAIGSHILRLTFYENGYWDVSLDRLWLEHTHLIETENVDSDHYNNIDYISKGIVTGAYYSLFMSMYHPSDWFEMTYSIPPTLNPISLNWKVVYSGMVSVYSGVGVLKIYIDGTEKLSKSFSASGNYDILDLGTFTGNSGTHVLKVYFYSETVNTDFHPSYIGVEIAS